MAEHRSILARMRSLMMGLTCVVMVGALACSDDGGTAGGLASGGSSAGAGGSAAAGTGGAPGGSGASAAPQGGAAPQEGGAGGSSAEVGIGGAVELEPGAGAGGDGDAPGEVRADAGSPPEVSDAVCPPGPFPANPLEGAAAPTTVCMGLTFAEGTVWFANLNQLFFSDFQLGTTNGRIMSYTPGGACAEFIPNAGTNGLVIAPDGNLLGARHSDQTITIFDLMTREPTVLVADNAGAAFNSPNDIAVRSDGNIYFTDPNYLLAGRQSEQPTRAYRRDPSGALTVIDENGNTNGIALSPDESKLYLSHLGGPNNIVVFDVDASGALSNQQPFANVGSDGMGIDCAGNLYITQGGVQVFSPDGEPLGTIAAQGAANVAFGGPERRTLYIAAATTLQAVELAIPGLPY
jgi:gluconolactonase